MSKNTFYKHKRVDASTMLDVDNLEATNLAVSVASISVLGVNDLEVEDTVATTMPEWRIGSEAILYSTSALAAATTVGCYVVNGSWTTSNSSSHVISHLSFLINTSNTNAMGKFIFYVSSKVAGGTKLGLLECHYYLQSGSTAYLSSITTTKSSNLTTLSAAITSTKNITVTTDSDCRCCWTAQMCI